MAVNVLTHGQLHTYDKHRINCVLNYLASYLGNNLVSLLFSYLVVYLVN